MLSSLRNGSGKRAGLDEAGEDVAADAALQGEHRDLAGLVGELARRGSPAQVLLEVLPVLDAVGGVDDQEVLALAKR